jgi:hypothetical protein
VVTHPVDVLALPPTTTMTRLLSLYALLALFAAIVSSELSPLDERSSDGVVELQGEGNPRFLQKRSVDTASPVEGEKASNDHATETAVAGTEDADKYVLACTSISMAGAFQTCYPRKEVRLWIRIWLWRLLRRLW